MRIAILFGFLFLLILMPIIHRDASLLVLRFSDFFPVLIPIFFFLDFSGTVFNFF